MLTSLVESDPNTKEVYIGVANGASKYDFVLGAGVLVGQGGFIPNRPRILVMGLYVY